MRARGRAMRAGDSAAGLLIRFLAIANVAGLTGCPASHPEADAGPDAGRDANAPAIDAAVPVDGARRLVELSDGEWASLCGWLASQPETPTYYCDGMTYLGSDPGACADCAFYDWRAETCSGPGGDASFWRSQPSDCEATVTMWEACRSDEVEARCFEAFLSTSACIALRCYPESTDAGVAPDGS